MKKYLLDTNICIFFIKGLHNIPGKVVEVGDRNCFISEITVAELRYGAENSKNVDSTRKTIEEFISKFAVILIYNSLGIYAKEKSKLRKQGRIIDDFDLLVAATAVTNEMTMVTNNVKHLGRLENVMIEDWTVSENR